VALDDEGCDVDYGNFGMLVQVLHVWAGLAEFTLLDRLYCEDDATPTGPFTETGVATGMR